MAGVKGRSGRKPKPKVPAVGLPAADGDSLDFLRSVIKDENAAPALRVRAAIAVAQYEHTKTSDGGKKDSAQVVASTVAKGKFGPSTAPPKLVSIK